MAQELPEKVAKHLKDVDVSTLTSDVRSALASLTDEELDVLARVKEKVRDAPDKVKAQIV